MGCAVLIANLTGDAYADIILGAMTGAGQSNSLPKAGEVYVIYGRPSGWSGTYSATTIANTNNNLGFALYGASANGWFGYSLSGGAFESKSRTSLVIGVPTNSEANAGKVQVLFMVRFVYVCVCV